MKRFFNLFDSFCKKNTFWLLIALLSTTSLYFIMNIVYDSVIARVGVGQVIADVINGTILIGVTVALFLLWINKKDKAFTVTSFLLGIYFLVASLLHFGDFANLFSFNQTIGLGITGLLTSTFVVLLGVLLLLKEFYKKDYKVCLDADVILLLAITFAEFIINCIVTGVNSGTLLPNIFRLFVQASLLLLFVSINERLNDKSDGNNIVEAKFETSKEEDIADNSAETSEIDTDL